MSSLANESLLTQLAASECGAVPRASLAGADRAGGRQKTVTLWHRYC